MTAVFGPQSYGNSARMFNADGTLNPLKGTGPEAVKWLLGNATQSVTWSSNLGFPIVSSYANFGSPVRFPPTGPNAIRVVPAIIGKRFAMIPFTWTYASAN